jgi:hypothetical protein
MVVTALPLLAIILALTIPSETSGTPEPSPKPIVLERTLAIESYPNGDELEWWPVADLGGPLQMQPGETRVLVIGVYACCYFFEPSRLDARWSVEPVDGVTVDGDGTLAIDSDVPDGTVITVQADIAGTGELVTTRVHVYSRETQPLVGSWRETRQIACEVDEEFTPQEPIGELRLDADGTFSVTWQPFEIYRDYWGTYEANLETGELLLTITGGNIEPADFNGTGTFEIREDGSLVLRGIWLGTPADGTSSPQCGHRFSR